MKLQRMVWVVDRFAIYAALLILAVLFVVALVYQHGPGTIIAGIALLLALYKGLVRLKIQGNSVVVCDGKVVFFVPETIVRNRFDFVSRGQTIVELPEYQLLDRTFDIDLFLPGREGAAYCCRLSLSLDYLMEPAAWQCAYDSFMKHGERLPLEVKKRLVTGCAQLELHPLSRSGHDALREYLTPVVAHLNRALESVGLEVVEVSCSFAEGPVLARLVAGDQQNVEDGPIGDLFTWHFRGEEASFRGQGGMLEVPGAVGV